MERPRTYFKEIEYLVLEFARRYVSVRNEKVTKWSQIPIELRQHLVSQIREELKTQRFYLEKKQESKSSSSISIISKMILTCRIIERDNNSWKNALGKPPTLKKPKEICTSFTKKKMLNAQHHQRINNPHQNLYTPSANASRMSYRDTRPATRKKTYYTPGYFQNLFNDTFCPKIYDPHFSFFF